MESEIERLRVMLEGRAEWSRSPAKPFQMAESTGTDTGYLSSDPEDDEKVLSYEHRVGGMLEHAIGDTGVQEALDFPQYGLQFAEEAPEGEVFCALKALQAYPYNYISAANRERVVKEFFANGLFYERAWDLFYIHSLFSPGTGGRKSIILIPLRQFRHFLHTINTTLKANFKLPDNASDSQLYFEFPKDGTPRPRYLGHTTEREMAEYLKKAIPASSFTPNGHVELKIEPTDKSLEAFKRKIDQLLESDKRKKGVNREKKKIERFAKQQAWRHEIKRVQRYLGLRKMDHGSSKTRETTERHLMSISPEKVKSGSAEHLVLGDNHSSIINIEDPAPYTQEDSVIFICVDVEAYERDHNLITEIGIAILDTADIKTLAPGEGGSNWMKAIRARHFRIAENGHLKNQEFINGCADYFQFGKSEWISINNAPQEVSKCFKPPYSRKLDVCSELADAPSNQHLGARRNVVLVGHDIITDINYLKKIGYDVNNLSNLQELVDTSRMYRAFQRESQPRNLGSILANLDIAGWHLHNAGNDAVYTLEAMIGIAVRALTNKPSEAFREQERAVRIAESIQIAEEAAREAQQGWSSESSDGGSPISPARQLQPKN